jgi:ElaB/YqjD/DUF883 family membrane-anchored ribosome-binding protein
MRIVMSTEPESPKIETPTGPVMEAALADLINGIETGFREGLKRLNAKSKPMIEQTEDQLEAAQTLVSDQVRKHPLTATALALGVGLVVGLLLSNGRRQ